MRQIRCQILSVRLSGVGLITDATLARHPASVDSARIGAQTLVLSVWDDRFDAAPLPE